MRSTKLIGRRGKEEEEREEEDFLRGVVTSRRPRNGCGRHCKWPATASSISTLNRVKLID